MSTFAVWLTNANVSCWNFKEGHRRRLQEAFPEANIRVCPNKDAFITALREADIAIAWVFKQDWLARAPRLTRIITPAAGRDFFRLDLPPGISLEYSSFHGRIMGETAMAMMLCHARGLLRSFNLQTREPWPQKELETDMRLLRGSRLTILGFGNIGRWVGSFAKPFGVRIRGVKRRPGPPPDYFDEKDRIISADRLDEVLPETDHLVLCLPGSPETDLVLSSERLKALPAHAGIYNIGRGNAIDEEALARALAAGEVGAAYLDVFRNEPLPLDSPLRTCPNCFIMPHISTAAPDFMDLFVEELTGRLA